MTYEFKREDGVVVERNYPMAECPREIVCEDGVRAVKIISMPYVGMIGKDGHSSGASASRLNADMRKRQYEAGKRMRDNWQSVKDN